MRSVSSKFIAAVAFGALFISSCAHGPPPARVSAERKAGSHVRPSRASDVLSVTFVDVKQGDAILIQLGDVDLLVDAGGPGGCANLRDSLMSVHGPLEALFITHPHDDHYGCAASEVIGRYEVKRIITNGEERGPPRDDYEVVGWTKFKDAAKYKGISLETPGVGTKLTLAEGLTLTVLATGSAAGGEFPDTSEGGDINNDSLVLRLDYAGRSVLLTGDIETQAGKMLVQRYCRGDDCSMLQSDVMKVPHHGSAKFSREFFERVHPSFAVVSADYRSTKHHLPRRQPIDVLRGLRAKIYSTSAEGTENVMLDITSSGTMTWHGPSQPVFAWDGTEGEEVSFAQ